MLSALWDGECGDDLGFIVRSRHRGAGNTTMIEVIGLFFIGAVPYTILVTFPLWMQLLS